METATILILQFVVATAVTIAVQRLAVPYTVVLVFTGLVLGLLNAFEALHLTKAPLFNVFLPGLLFEAAFQRSFGNSGGIDSSFILSLPGVVAAIALTSRQENRGSERCCRKTIWTIDGGYTPPTQSYLSLR